MFKPFALTAIIALTLITGCSKLTKENYDQIKMGMEYDEVIALLGKPSTCQESIGIKSCEWKSGDKKVLISFIGDSVTIFSSDNIK